MPAVEVATDGCWPDLAGRPIVNLMAPDGPPIRLALLPGGMTSGRASVVLRIDLPDGRTVLTETSLQLLINAVLVMQEAEAGWRIS